MEFDPAWGSAMVIISEGHKQGWSAGDIRTLGLNELAGLVPDPVALFEALSQERDRDPVTFDKVTHLFFDARSKALAQKVAEEKAAIEDLRKPLEARYLTLRRTAFTVPRKRRFGGRSHLRIHHDASWMRLLGKLLPSCADGHSMNLVVILTAAEIDQCIGPREDPCGGIFCACIDPECIGLEKSWRLFLDHSIYHRVLAASGCEPQPLATFPDSPSASEDGLDEFLQEAAPQMDCYAVADARIALAERYHQYGKTKIGGFGSYANARWCEQCQGTKHHALLTLDLADVGISAEEVEEGHLQVTLCQTCGRPECQLECT